MNSYNKIYNVVRQIPYGRVVTYGQVAEFANLYGKARLVGYALFQVSEPETKIPWHRVVNAKGEISYSSLRQGGDYLQRSLLEAEGIEFSAEGKINLARYQWQPNSDLQ